MAGRPEKKTPADPGSVVILDAIEQALRDGTVSEDLDRLTNSEIRQRLNTIISDILDTQLFALAMAQGNLSRDLEVKGYLAGSLKSLQANLRHLTWQAGQIAQGDFTQRVQFMGDFSVSFNTMVEHLANDADNRNRHEQQLRDVNTALSENIAEHIRLEKALGLTNRKLNLLSSITRHDIRNQLMALGFCINLSQNNMSDPVALKTYFDREDSIVQTIINQINFTKDYEDLGIKEPVWNNLDEILAKISPTLLFGTTKLVTDTAGVEIFADLLVSKVFYNLIDNALRYGGPSMTEIRITAAEGPDNLVITVQDDGAGIAEKDREKLFTKGFGKNTGFGLHLSREILSLTGITIVEDSEPGTGARFRITVPKEDYRRR
jgi:signal transduction histidine kinase